MLSFTKHSFKLRFFFFYGRIKVIYTHSTINEIYYFLQNILYFFYITFDKSTIPIQSFFFNFLLLYNSLILLSNIQLRVLYIEKTITNVAFLK
jgi:hypothetical protein